jgi:hypothetical protein
MTSLQNWPILQFMMGETHVNLTQGYGYIPFH